VLRSAVLLLISSGSDFPRYHRHCGAGGRLSRPVRSGRSDHIDRSYVVLAKIQGHRSDGLKPALAGLRAGRVYGFDAMPSWIDPFVGTPEERMAKLRKSEVPDRMWRDVGAWTGTGGQADTVSNWAKIRSSRSGSQGIHRSPPLPGPPVAPRPGAGAASAGPHFRPGHTRDLSGPRRQAPSRISDYIIDRFRLFDSHVTGAQFLSCLAACRCRRAKAINRAPGVFCR
jgi:hypothetical protein